MGEAEYLSPEGEEDSNCQIDQNNTGTSYHSVPNATSNKIKNYLRNV